MIPQWLACVVLSILAWMAALIFVYSVVKVAVSAYYRARYLHERDIQEKDKHRGEE